jgi:two-component system sensor histidine kinase DesK
MSQSFDLSPRSLSGSLPRWLLPLIWIIWLPFLAPPVLELLRGHHPPALVVLALAGVAAFVGVYAWAAQRNPITHGAPAVEYSAPSLASAWPVAVLAALSLAFTLGLGAAWGGMFIYTGASIGPRFTTQRAVWLVGIWTLIAAAAGLFEHAELTAAGQICLLTGGIGISVVLLTHTARTVRELREARAEVARLAVADERLRFARDLHDLLGHSLSLIALKCDLLGSSSPTRRSGHGRR